MGQILIQVCVYLVAKQTLRLIEFVLDAGRRCITEWWIRQGRESPLALKQQVSRFDPLRYP